jgi:tRNA-(ms[2]io[6]A)-hydroxylase
VVEDLDELLVDHAHCEKKAAGTAITLIFRYGHHEFLLEPLSRLAREELQHFEQVLAILHERGSRFRILHPSPYAGRLRKAERSHEPERLLDALLCCALIEARSCERFQLLAEAAPEARLREFYRGLYACEARHHGLYVDLASQLAGADATRARLPTLAKLEAEALAACPPQPRMHA